MKWLFFDSSDTLEEPEDDWLINEFSLWLKVTVSEISPEAVPFANLPAGKFDPKVFDLAQLAGLMSGVFTSFASDPWIASRSAGGKVVLEFGFGNFPGICFGFTVITLCFLPVLLLELELELICGTIWCFWNGFYWTWSKFIPSPKANVGKTNIKTVYRMIRETPFNGRGQFFKLPG